jgi:hypothetical protein
MDCRTRHKGLLAIIFGAGASGVASAAPPTPAETVATFRVD